MTIPGACFAFGVHLDHDDIQALPWCADYSGDDRPEFEHWVADIHGLPRPETSPQGELKTALDACPIVTRFYDNEGTDSCVIIAVRGTLTSADWDRVERPSTIVNPATVQAAQEFCAQHRIPFTDPSWILAVYTRA